MTKKTKLQLRTNVSSSESEVERFNKLNSTLTLGIPHFAHAYDTLIRHLPLLKQMQSLLSQRPRASSPEGEKFRFRRNVNDATLHAAVVTRAEQLPTWQWWIKEYANAIDYSVRHIRRLIMHEPRMKSIKECGWSVSDHNHLLRAATLTEDLVNALEANADTTALIAEAKELFREIDRDILDKAYTPRRRSRPKRPARPATRAD